MHEAQLIPNDSGNALRPIFTDMRVLFFSLVFFVPGLGSALGQTGIILQEKTATDEEIATLVESLSHPVFATRTEAMHRLTAIGAPATDALRTASVSPDPELALRAKHLLRSIDRVWFSGVEIGLAFSKSTITWDEAVDLQITLTNNSSFPARIPFELNPVDSAISEDAKQVAHMLDTADWLQVQDGNGRAIELRVDDLRRDAGVEAAVQVRLREGPVGTLEAGEKITFLLNDFNRGWARYPFLDRGRFTVLFEYMPQWEDEQLSGSRIGLVRSNEISINVVSSAPEAVSRSGAESTIRLDQDGEHLAAWLTNHDDRSMVVNRNFGGAPPFAVGRWVCSSDNTARDLPVMNKHARSWSDFENALLSEVDPGESIELTRCRMADLQKTAVETGVNNVLTPGMVSFHYLNQCDRIWQLKQPSHLRENETTPRVLREPLPARLLSGRLMSVPISVPRLP